jgi:hypothetical protein
MHSPQSVSFHTATPSLTLIERWHHVGTVEAALAGGLEAAQNILVV